MMLTYSSKLLTFFGAENCLIAGVKVPCPGCFEADVGVTELRIIPLIYNDFAINMGIYNDFTINMGIYNDFKSDC